ncbi:MAG: hypothetical protein JWQ09_5855 [Segetibacter sp.]|nr:hypothetical protein [Segetibacter sp.]
MADQIHQDGEAKTRANLAYIFAFGSIIMLGYILYRWGDKTEILTLVIGLIGGTLLGGVSAVYFGGSTGTKKPDTTVSSTGDNQTVNVTPPAVP